MKKTLLLLLFVVFPYLLFGDDVLLSPKEMGVKDSTFGAFLLSVCLMTTGFYLPAALDFLRTGKLHKKFTKIRLFVSFTIVLILGGLLIFVPDTKEFLTNIIQFAPDIEEGVGGFIFIGYALYNMLKNTNEDGTIQN